MIVYVLQDALWGRADPKYHRPEEGNFNGRGARTRCGLTYEAYEELQLRDGAHTVKTRRFGAAMSGRVAGTFARPCKVCFKDQR